MNFEHGKFFTEQCTPLENGRVLPKSQTFWTQSRLCYLDLNKDEILKIIRALNLNKAHDHGDISNRMIKICDKSLLKPLTLLFEYLIKNFVTQTYGKDLILHLWITRTKNN